MKSIKIFLLTTTIFSLACVSVFADEIKIPLACYPKAVQQAFQEKGYKLDLSGNDRDENSWGFLENKGSTFSIFTYKSVSKEELQMIVEIINGKDGG